MFGPKFVYLAVAVYGYGAHIFSTFRRDLLFLSFSPLSYAMVFAAAVVVVALFFFSSFFHFPHSMER